MMEMYRAEEMSGAKMLVHYLSEYSLAVTRIAVLKEEFDRLVGIVTDTNNALGSIGKREESERLYDAIERVSTTLLAEIDNITDRCMKIEEMIASLRDPEMRAVFECRYFNRMTFAAIGKRLFMSSTKAKTLHASGVEIVNKRYKV